MVPVSGITYYSLAMIKDSFPADHCHSLSGHRRANFDTDYYQSPSVAQTATRHLKIEYCMKLNKEWHLSHPMPKNPSFEQRIKWHIDHQKHCGCRKPPQKLAEEIRIRQLSANALG